MTFSRKRSAVASSVTRSPGETMALGGKFAGRLRKGDIVALQGGLGSGKTTFVQGILNSFGIRKFARSASFVLVNEFASSKGRIFHMDLYRLNGSDMDGLGLEEYLSAGGITVIEWADKLKKGALRPDYDISFKWLGETKRKIIISENEPA